MKTKEEVIYEITNICEQSHRKGDGCIFLRCSECDNGWNILEGSNESIWKKYKSGCDRCGSEYKIELGHSDL